MTNTEKIEYILKELIEKENLSAISDFFTPNYLVHTSKKDYRGHTCIKKWVKELNNFLYDLRVVKIEFLNQNDSNVTWKRSIRGKIKPGKNKNLKEGKVLKWTEMIVSTFENGKISEEWTVSEFHGELFKNF